MKRRDVLFLALAIGIFGVTGYIGYTQLVPQKSHGSGVDVEVVGTIPSQLDSSGLSWLTNTAKVHDFSSLVDLSGLGNSSPFGP